MAATWLMASTAQAEPDPVIDPDPGLRENTLAIAVAIVPGIALHGMGHLVAGDLETAKQLFFWESAGLGLAAIGGGFIFATGAGRYVNEVSIPLVVAGAGLFINSFAADIYGITFREKSPLAYRERPTQSASLGYAYIYDPQFSYRNFTLASARLALGDFIISPRLWVAVDADNQRARLPVRYDFWRNAAGERLSVTGAATLHHFGNADFTTTLVETSLTGRIDLTRVGATLKGSFTSLQIGYGLQRIDYDIDNVGPDYNGLLLSRFSYGFYLPFGGELESYYAHRRDGFAGGLSPSERNGSGFLGHVGLQLRQPVNEQFSLRAGTELGSAWIVHTGFEVRLGGER